MERVNLSIRMTSIAKSRLPEGTRLIPVFHRYGKHIVVILHTLYRTALQKCQSDELAEIKALLFFVFISYRIFSHVRMCRSKKSSHFFSNIWTILYLLGHLCWQLFLLETRLDFIIMSHSFHDNKNITIASIITQQRHVVLQNSNRKTKRYVFY